MSDYDNTNTIALWKNEKEGNERRPDLKGNANINGIEVKVSLWKNDSENPNAPFLKGKIEVAEAVAAAPSSDEASDFDF